MIIGKIVHSTSHLEYICQIYGPLEASTPVEPQYYRYGGFVGCEGTVGILYRSQLQNPDFGNLGPRLSSSEQNQVFSPDLLSEQAVLVGILWIGYYEGDRPIHGTPPHVVPLHSEVRALSLQEIQEFHQTDGAFKMGYYPLLQGIPNAIPLLEAHLKGLQAIFPEEQAKLKLLEDALAWQRIQR